MISDALRRPGEQSRGIGLLLVAMVLGACSFGSQIPDLDYRFEVEAPRFPSGSGPRIAIDAAHGNFHTVDGRFAPFARLLSDDGYSVGPLEESLSAAALADVDVLVIANPLAQENAVRWRLPTYPAYSPSEISSLLAWVQGGGSLLLIADHMPFPGAAEELAAAFGFYFANGYAQDATGDGHIVYSRDKGTLTDHEIANGFAGEGRVSSVKVFTGQAFRADPEIDARPILVLPPASKVLLPSKPRDFDERTPYVRADGLWQGATRHLGAGRVAVFGEAAMFTAQLSVRGETRTSIGMSAEGAEENARFVLNVAHWLTPAPALSTELHPTWSPDGKEIAFDSDRDGSTDIWVMTLSTGEARRLTLSGAEDARPAWSPDGEWIAFHSDRDGDLNLYAIRPDGSGLRRLTSGANDESNASWEPNSRRLVFEERLDEQTWQLFVVDADGRGKRSLLPRPGSYLTAAWLPEDRIAFSYSPPGGNHDTEIVIQSVDTEGRDLQALLGGEPGNSNVDYSPVTGRLTFNSIRDGNWEIYTAAPGGGDAQRLTTNGEPGMRGIDGQPAWSPDGRGIAFASGAAGSLDLVVFGADGASARNLTESWEKGSDLD